MTTENVIKPQTDSSKNHRCGQLKIPFNSSLAKNPIAEKLPNKENITMAIVVDSMLGFQFESRYNVKVMFYPGSTKGDMIDLIRQRTDPIKIHDGAND